ncbi:Restriction endonuclease [Lentzea californiensis]|nr:Restriction endonuclease [Lentzea californiensis]
MLGRPVLVDEFNRLKADPDAHRRGYALEQLLVQAFRKAHFKVEHNSGAASPRQTDLTATYGTDRYLIEAKWDSDPLNTSHIDDMRLARLGRTEGTVVGVIFSVNGFRDSAIHEVAARRERSVLLFGEVELEQILADPLELVRLLRIKRDELVVHGRAHLATSETTRRAKPRDSKDLPGTGVSLLDSRHHQVPYVTAGGEFGRFTFAQTVADIDWGFGVGFGVALDLPIRINDAEGIVELLYEMHRMGWVTDQPRWNIQQAQVNWHGVGARSFVETLRDWQSRTEALADPHHSEEVTYYDVCAGGFVTLTANLAAHDSRSVLHCNVSFQLAGVPLDANPIKHLYERFNVMGAPHFRSLNDRAVERYWPPRDDAVPLEVVGFIAERHAPGLDMECCDWVTGVAAKNPYLRRAAIPAPPDWPDHLSDSELLVCDLRSHHPLGEPRSSYHLYGWELARTSDALVVRIVVDW